MIAQILFLFAFQARAEVSIPDVLTKPIESRVQWFQALGEKGKKMLSQAAFDGNSALQIRWRALTTMGRMGADHFRKDFERALASRDWYMRNAALIGLQTGQRDFAVKWSMRLLDDPALVVRTQAVRNLIQLDGREAEAKLWAQIFSRENFRGQESLWVRAHIAEALARFTSPGRAKHFERLLLDSDTRLHKWAIMGLENTTGIKIGGDKIPLDVRRKQWLERLGAQEI